jgi:hypothetical protein
MLIMALIDYLQSHQGRLDPSRDNYSLMNAVQEQMRRRLGIFPKASFRDVISGKATVDLAVIDMHDEFYLLVGRDMSHDLGKRQESILEMQRTLVGAFRFYNAEFDAQPRARMIQRVRGQRDFSSSVVDLAEMEIAERIPPAQMGLAERLSRISGLPHRPF